MTNSKIEPILIKKYSNRRLYNTRTSTYINLDDLYRLIKDDIEFEVREAKTNLDITRITLTQIIFEQEAKGYNLLPISFLLQIIKFYNQDSRQLITDYLEMVMDVFTKNNQSIDLFNKSTTFEIWSKMINNNFELIKAGLNKFQPPKE